MKAFITPGHVFTPGASGVGSIDLSAIPSFDIRRLVAIINQTQGALIYSTASPLYKFTGVIGSTVSLFSDTSAMSGVDQIQIIYDDEAIPATAGLQSVMSTTLDDISANLGLQSDAPTFDPFLDGTVISILKGTQNTVIDHYSYLQGMNDVVFTNTLNEIIDMNAGISGDIIPALLEIKEAVGIDDAVAPTRHLMSGAKIQTYADHFNEAILLGASGDSSSLQQSQYGALYTADLYTHDSLSSIKAQGVSDAVRIGSITETAPFADTASSGLNGRLQRIAQRLTDLIALLPLSLGQKVSAQSLAVTIASDQPALPVSASSPTFSSGSRVFMDFAVTNITNAAYVQILASLAVTTKTIQIFMTIGQPLILAIGAPASEVDTAYIIPGGNGVLDVQIPAGSRLSVKALPSAATVVEGTLIINVMG